MSWVDAVPAQIVQALERPDDPIEVVEEHYGAAYARNLY